MLIFYIIIIGGVIGAAGYIVQTAKQKLQGDDDSKT